MADAIKAQADPRSTQSLEVVESELDRALASHARRSDVVDTKVGLLRGAAGVIVGLRIMDTQLVAVISQLLAGAAGGLSVWSIWPRQGTAVDPLAFRQQYLNKDPNLARLARLDTTTATLAEDEAQLRKKSIRFKAAAITLALSIGVSLSANVSTSIQHEWQHHSPTGGPSHEIDTVTDGP